MSSPLKCKMKKESAITAKQVEFLSSLNDRHNILVDYDIYKLTKNEASRKIDKILSTYGRV